MCEKKHTKQQHCYAYLNRLFYIERKHHHLTHPCDQFGKSGSSLPVHQCGRSWVRTPTILLHWLAVGSFTFLQHLKSYQDWQRVVTLYTHGNFIVLPAGKAGHWYHDPISHSVRLPEHRANQSMPYPIISINAEHQSRKRQAEHYQVMMPTACSSSWPTL